MGIFSNLVYGKVNDLVSNAISSTGPLSTTIQALNNFKNYLEHNIGQKTEALAGWFTDVNELADNALDSIELDVRQRYIGVMDSDMASQLRTAMYNVSNQGRVVLTDASGAPYLLKIKSSMPVSGTVISTSQVPGQDDLTWADIIRAILDCYGDDYVVGEIRTACKYVANTYYEGSFTDETIFEIVSGMTTSTQPTIRGKLWDTLAAIQGYTEHLPLVEHPLVYIENGVVKVDNLIVDSTGAKAFLFDVLSDQVESEALDEMLLDFVRLSCSGRASDASIIDTASRYVNSKYASVKNAAMHIKYAYQTSGFYGLAKAILNFGKTGASITDDDGVFKFTDNDKLVPAQYIAGMVSTALVGIGAVASIIASAFNQVIGYALMVLGQLVSSVVQNINFDYTQSHASVVDDLNVFVPVTPHAGLYGSVTTAQAPDFMKQVTEAGYSCGAMHVVGGYVLFGPSGFADGVPTGYNWEFHPGLDDPTDVCMFLASRLEGAVGLASGSRICSYFAATNYKLGELRDLVRDAWLDYNETKVWNNSANGYLSDSDDDALAANAFINTLLFQAWANAANKADASGEDTQLSSLKAYSQIKLTELNPGYASLMWYPNISSAPLCLDCAQGVSAEVQPYSWLCLACSLGAPTMFDNDGTFTGGMVISVKPSWTNLPYMITATRDVNGTGFTNSASLNGMKYLGINKESVFDQVISLPADSAFAVKVPAYDKSTFWKYVVIGAIVATAVVVGTVVASVATIRKITEVQARNSADVYGKYDTFTKKPTHENYKIFAKARLKNNLFAGLTGGTMFSKVSVWETTGGKTRRSFVGTIYSKFLGSDEAMANAGFTISDEIAVSNEQILEAVHDTMTLIDGVAR